jgi:hypothetical protein
MVRPGHNPLRRSVDRIEVALMIALVAVFLVGAPFAGMATSAWARNGAAAASRLERATRHPVAAVVERGVPQQSNPFGAAYPTKVAVRWTLDGVMHTGTVKAAAGTPAGATVRIWTSQSGEQTGPPLDPSQITHQGALAGALAVAGLAVLVIASALVIRQILDRRRMAWWDTEWSATGPQWCNYR